MMNILEKLEFEHIAILILFVLIFEKNRKAEGENKI